MKYPEGFEAYFKQWEDKTGAFIEWNLGTGNSADTTTPLPTAYSPIPFAVKDILAVQGWGLTCGSKLLAGLRSPYTATAVKRLQDAGFVVIGKTNMDEFGMGSSTDNSGLKRSNNPWDVSRVCGGSSGGTAACVASGQVPFALGSDTGGSVRQPAAFCGVVGLKPTWGAVSRFGLVAYASSLDSVGVCADTVERARQVFRVIRGKDALDQTSKEVKSKEVNGKVIGVLKADELSPAVRQGFDKAKEGFRQLGYTLVEVDFPSLKYAVPAYYTIATAEASANLARYDGIRYGQRPVFAENPDDLVDKTRDAGFGPEVKLRILLGTFVLRSGFQDRYYLRAQRIRAGIRQQFEAVLRDKCAAILMPVFPTQAFRHGDAAMTPLQQKVADVYTCCANLAGLPALSFQGAVEPDEDWTRLPVGVQLLGPAFGEEALCDIAARYEAAHPFEHPEGWKAWWE